MYAAYARLVRPLAVFIGGLSLLPRINRQLVAVDKFVQRLTKGRVGLVVIAGLPGLMLTVKGAKSGLPRTTPLLCTATDDGWLVAGSNWGQPSPPAWVGNLAAATEASVNVAGVDHHVVPREVLGEERDRCWEQLNQTWPNYAKYATRTDRTIRVFALQRA